MEFKRTTDLSLIATMNRPVQELHHRLYPDLFVPYDQSAMEDYFSMTVDNDQFYYIVAYDLGEPVGFVCFEEMIKPENAIKRKTHRVYVHQISVNENMQGKGIGKALMAEVMAFAKEKAVKSIELDYWIKNEQATSFYKALGFSNRKDHVSLVVSKATIDLEDTERING